MLLRIVSGVILGVLLTSAAAAQEPFASLSLPQLAPCSDQSRPRLPEKWTGTYLMAPFTKGQLVLAEITADAGLSAMRVKLHGVKRGSLDLFVTGNQTYVLETDDASIKQCRALGDTGWRPLPQDLLASSAQCAGTAPVGETEVSWWKTPIAPEPASFWQWYKTADQTPFRFLFPFSNDRLPPFSRYAFSYQVRFNALEETDLAGVAALCKQAKPQKSARPARALHARIDALSKSRDRAESEIGRLMPELRATCPAAPMPQWPEQLAITGLMTPFDSDERPYATEVLYDWSVPGQRTRIFGGPEPGIVVQDALLLDPHGYNVTHFRGDERVCRRVLPGTLRPDWPMRGRCECAATIEGTTALSPYGTTRILNCPLASPRVAWAWYNLSGRPTVFMVTSMRGDEGKRLFGVLDYHAWLPGHSVPRSIFAKPPQCMPAPTSPPRQCFTCHVGPKSAR
jgi:hypothetical protein